MHEDDAEGKRLAALLLLPAESTHKKFIDFVSFIISFMYLSCSILELASFDVPLNKI